MARPPLPPHIFEGSPGLLPYVAPLLALEGVCNLCARGEGMTKQTLVPATTDRTSNVFEKVTPPQFRLGPRVAGRQGRPSVGNHRARHLGKPGVLDLFGCMFLAEGPDCRSGPGFLSVRLRFAAAVGPKQPFVDALWPTPFLPFQGRAFAEHRPQTDQN